MAEIAASMPPSPTRLAAIVTVPVAAVGVAFTLLVLGIAAYGLGTSRVTAAEAVDRELGQAWLTVVRQDSVEGRRWMELAAANHGLLAQALAACAKVPQDRSGGRAACNVTLWTPEAVTAPAGPAR